MSRRFGRRLAFDLAATLVVVFTAVSVGDIDDYDMHSQAMRLPARIAMSVDATAELSSTTSDSGSDSHHVCACLLCVLTVVDSHGSRVLPPSPGKLSIPILAALAGSPHSSEIFHPPSA